MVESEGDSFTLANGQGEFYYDLDDKANKTFITITDMTGKTVATGQGEVSAGKHKFVWDGKDQAGNPVRDGSYMIRVSAVDEAGDDVPVTTSVTNVVNSLSMVDGKPVLYVGDNSDVEVPLDKVLAVRFKDFF
jgi:flagellar hook assembly protein FlgD